MTNDDLQFRTAIATEFPNTPTLRLLRGDKFTTGTSFTGVADQNTKQVLLENGSTDKALLVLNPEVSGSGETFIRKIKNPTVDTLGDELTIINPKTDVNGDTDATVCTAGDNETGVISNGVEYPELIRGSGTNAANARPGISGDGRITDVVMPGDTLAVSARNTSGSIQDLSILLEFVEFEVGLIDLIPEPQV